MYAAQLFNERVGKKQKAIYGCATSGFSWAFIELENNIMGITPIMYRLHLIIPTAFWLLCNGCWRKVGSKKNKQLIYQILQTSILKTLTFEHKKIFTHTK